MILLNYNGDEKIRRRPLMKRLGYSGPGKK